MKKKFFSNTKRIAVLALCAMLLPVGCGRSDELPEEMQWSTGEGAEDVQQVRLDQIDPGAYSSVEGLELEPGTKISMIMKSSGDDSYWSQVKAGAKQAEDELNEALGYSGNDAVKVQISGPTTAEDAEDQINLLDEELDANPGAVIISLIDADACEVQFDLATENGIPIVTMDSGSAYSGITTSCSTDNKAAAVKAAKEMCKLIDDEGEIVLLVHDSISETADQREKAFRKEIKKNHPDVKIVDTMHLDKMDVYKEAMAAEQNGTIEPLKSISKAEKINWAEKKSSEDSSGDTDEAQGEEDNKVEQDGEDNTSEQGEEDNTSEQGEKDNTAEQVQAEDITDTEVLQWMLAKHPDMKGIFTSNDNTAKYLAEDTEDASLLKDLTVVSFDAGETQLQNLDSGLVDGLIVQNPYGMGYASVVAAARTILGMGNESEIDTGYAWVTKDNLSNTEIKALLYK